MNKRFKYKSIEAICSEIDLIIEKKDNKTDYKSLFIHLERVLHREINYTEIVRLCETILIITGTKNRIIRHLEKDFWHLIIKIPFQLIIFQGIEIIENEELKSNLDYNNNNKKILSRLFGLCKEILELQDDHSKGSELRRAGALEIIGELINYYHIPEAKTLFLNSIKSKNKKEQYSALLGLENYYAVTEDEIENELNKTLNEIIRKTDDRTVASTCLQIQINAGIIDEMTAVFEIDDWKDEHYD